MSTKNPRAWYRIENSADDGASADVYVYDAIGKWYSWDDEAVTAKQFIKDLQGLGENVKTIRVHINSPGGDCAEALAIANMLKAQRDEKGRTVECLIEGIALSAATIISSAGNPIRMADNALMMTHDPWGIQMGSAPDMRKYADILDQFRNAIVATYQWVSKKTPEELQALMAAETWMTAAEALEHGFVTDVISGVEAAAASFDQRVLAIAKVPEKHREALGAFLKKEQPAPTAAAALEVMAACREAGCVDLAEDFIRQGLTLEKVHTKAGETKTARAAAAQREKDITALCASQKYPELAAGYIKGGQSIADVKAHLAVITARAGNPEINGALPVDGGAQKPVIDVTDIYAARNGK